MKSLATLGVLVLLLPVWAFALPIQCQCVMALRSYAGVNIKGDAATLVPNLPFKNLEIKDVILMRYGRVYHAAQIIGFSEDLGIFDGAIAPRRLLIQEWNFEPCKYTQRSIPLDDEHIIGILRP